MYYLKEYNFKYNEDYIFWYIISIIYIKMMKVSMFYILGDEWMIS